MNYGKRESRWTQQNLRQWPTASPSYACHCDAKAAKHHKICLLPSRLKPPPPLVLGTVAQGFRP
eukprot:904935-Amphidinium_carterae.1